MKQRGNIVDRASARSFGGEATLPLFAALELADVHCEREQLLSRIKLLRPRSHRRVELEFRLRQLTLREMALELDLVRRGRA